MREERVAFETAALQSGTVAVAAGAEAPVRFAAAELQRYLQALTAIQVPIEERASVAPYGLVLGDDGTPAAALAATNGDEFVISPTPRHVRLTAGSPRGLLHATYVLLEQFGCRWSPHGSQAEQVPRLATPLVELQETRRAPRFAVRGYCTDIMTYHYTQPEQFASRLGEDRAFIDWMAKSGANGFFFVSQPFDTQLTIPELLPEFQRRGIDLEYGGHVIPLLLPRDLYREHPKYFPEAPTGGRTDLGNLCASSAAALATAARNAVAYVREYPELRVLHLWGADVWSGAWCRCTACAAMSVQDQSLKTCNTVARALAEAGLNRPVCYLAYHDTIEPHVALRPEANVVAEFAPRERCYAHALNDPECATNRRYAAALERHVDLFDGRVRLFEYYGDAILFCGCPVPLGEVIAADLDYYARLGVREITMLQFGAFSLWAYPLNFAVFARATLERAQAAAIAGDYCARFGPRAELARSVLAELTAVMQQVVTYGDIRRPPRSAASAARILPKIEAAVPRLAALAERLAALPDGLAGSGELTRYTQLILEGVQCEVHGTLAGAGGAATAAAHALYQRALQVMERVDPQVKGLWGSVDLSIIHHVLSATTSIS